MDSYQWDQMWEALTDRLKEHWGSDYESRAYYAQRVLGQVPPGLLRRLAALPIAVQTNLADSFARAGAGVGGMPVEDVLFATELIANPQSRYWKPANNTTEERELHSLARGLVGELMQNVPDGHVPAGQPEPPGRSASTQTSAESDSRDTDARVEGMARLKEKMAVGGPYWDKSHPQHEHVRREVQRDLQGLYPESGAGEGGVTHA